jgi:molybdenum-dependent DNA-binding transcriptional regulator ModE
MENKEGIKIENVWSFDFIELGDIKKAAAKLDLSYTSVYNVVKGITRSNKELVKAALLAVNSERQQRIKQLSKVTEAA